MSRLLSALLAAACSAALAAPPRYAGRYALVLEDPPVLKRLAARESIDSPKAREASRAIRARQAELRRELERRGFHVTAAVDLTLNAVFVAANEKDAAKLRDLPGVRRLAWLPRWKLQLNEALPLLKVQEAWTQLGGVQNAGAGVKIAILDTGIDQTHPAFDDPSLQAPQDIPRCEPQPRPGDSECAYTNKKVIVARSYVWMTAAGFDDEHPELTSRPDDLSPRDRVGHGTALAMIAAGKQVSPPLAAISGVAPKAFLGNYKLYGSPGVNDYFFDDALFKALDDVIADKMDIAVMSFGGPALWGPLDKGAACRLPADQFCDLRIDAIETAISKGLTVVISAGNGGDLGSRFPSLNTITAPGTSPSAITVGASFNRHAIFSSVRVSGDGVPSELQDMEALFGDGPRVAVGPAPVRDVAALGTDGQACEALPPGSLNGAVALVLRGDCFFSDKLANVFAAGAKAMLLYDPEGSDFPFSITGLTQTPIPAAVVGKSDGEALKRFLQTNPNAQAALDPALRAVPDNAVDHVADFSSRGPSIGEMAIKPEVVAVGTSLYTATQHYDPNSDMYDPSRYGAFDGTSFSAPMAAGVAALVKQKNPTWGPAQIKSALVNTATAIDASVLSSGAGKINAEAAVKTDVTVNPATVSFGVVDSSAVNKRVVLQTSAPPGTPLTAELTDSRLRLEKGDNSFIITFVGPVPPAGVYSGDIRIRGGAVELRVPYLYLVGDGVPHSVTVLGGDNFDDLVNESVLGCTDPRSALTFKVVDQYGVPANGTVLWEASSGGGEIITADAGTDKYGIAGACVQLGPGPGEQSFKATVNGSKDLTAEWFGTARLSPSINTNGVVDAASNTVDPTRGLVPGSYISIYGTALADFVRFATAPATPDIPLHLPISLARTSVSFDVPSNKISVPGPLLYVSPTQINVQIPWELAGLNQAFMKVSIGDFSSAVYTVPLTAAAPQLYQYPPDSNMRGFAVVQRSNSPDLINFSNPAQKGEFLTMYANGLGPVDPPVPTGEVSPLTVLSRTRNNVTVTIGGRPAEVSFSGLAPGFVGLYQIDVLVPKDAPSGSQPIVVNVNGVTSQPANVVIQ